MSQPNVDSLSALNGAVEIIAGDDDWGSTLRDVETGAEFTVYADEVPELICLLRAFERRARDTDAPHSCTAFGTEQTIHGLDQSVQVCDLCGSLSVPDG